MSLTSREEDEGGASIDDTSSQRQDGVAAVGDRLVNTPEVGYRRGRREWNVVHRDCCDRVVIAKGKLSGVARLGNWDVVPPRILFLERYCRDYVGVADHVIRQVDRPPGEIGG